MNEHASRRQPTPLVAYFSMEIALASSIPTYSGGLGVLAGDTIRSAADLAIPMVAVTLVHRQGYFFQRLDDRGRQSEEPMPWQVDDVLERLAPTTTVEIEDRLVKIQCWRYDICGVTGFRVPVYLLDTDVPENTPFDRTLTDALYGGDSAYRLCQEVILGIGGVRMLQALGFEKMMRFHMNEGHAAFLVLALLDERLPSIPLSETTTLAALEAVRKLAVFTTHTPVPAGHDQFPIDLAKRILGARQCSRLFVLHQRERLNMTDLAIQGARYINGVALQHGQVSRGMFPGHPIHSITNGVHHITWTAPSFQALYDEYLPDWRYDPYSLRYAVGIPHASIWAAHMDAKRALIELVNRTTNAGFSQDIMTIGFARRATAYKRTSLLFSDIHALRGIVERSGRIQIVFSGKAHPRDEEGKRLIQKIHEVRAVLSGHIPVAYVPNYDMGLAKQISAGVDVWLNTPMPPLEASGTSGMKAALNGVPSFSVLDGWWVEGHVEGVTGWAIGDPIESLVSDNPEINQYHASSLYHKLEHDVLPCFYQHRERFVQIMRSAIALNGAFYHTHRMMWQYLNNAYRLHKPEE